MSVYFWPIVNKISAMLIIFYGMHGVFVSKIITCAAILSVFFQQLEVSSGPPNCLNVNNFLF